MLAHPDPKKRSPAGVNTSTTVELLREILLLSVIQDKVVSTFVSALLDGFQVH